MNMAVLFRGLFRLTLGLIVLAVVASMLVWWLTSRSLPDNQATTEVEGQRDRTLTVIVRPVLSSGRCCPLSASVKSWQRL